MENPRRTFPRRSGDLGKARIIFISMERGGMQIRTVGEGENLLSASRH